MRNFLIPAVVGWSVPAIARLLGFFNPIPNPTVSRVIMAVDFVVLGFAFGYLSFLGICRLVEWNHKRKGC